MEYKKDVAKIIIRFSDGEEIVRYAPNAEDALNVALTVALVRGNEITAIDIKQLFVKVV